MKTRTIQPSLVLVLTAGTGIAVGSYGLDPAPQGSPPGTGNQPAIDAPAHATIGTSGDADIDGERRPLTGIAIQYVRISEGQPSLDLLADGKVTLGVLDDGFTAPRAGIPVREMRLGDLGTSEPKAVYDLAIPTISAAIFNRLKDLGLMGAFAEPDREQMRVENGRIVDLRAGTTTLTWLVTTGNVAQVRSVALGDRFAETEQLVNNPAHARILDRSPIATPAAGETGVLLNASELDRFAYRMNRHPGRRVDVSVAPTGEAPGAVAVDYLVTENRPWMLYAQVRRDGNRNTDEWRYRFGFIHNQLTNNDDVLSLDYTTSFDNINAFSGRYERPFSSDGRLRSAVYGQFYTYSAADVGQPDATFEGEGFSLGAEAIYNVWQGTKNPDMFVDVIGGLRYDHIDVENNLAALQGDDGFLLAYAGARFERRREDVRTTAQAMVEFSIDGASDEARDTLGRFNAAENWQVLRADVNHEFYLEPLFDPSLAASPGLRHEIGLRAAAQTSFGQRLIPNYQDVIGGMYTVRGYPEAVAAGDQSLVLSAEYRFHVANALGISEEPGSFMGRPFRWRPQYEYGPTDWDLIARAFVDAGWTRNIDRESFEIDQTLIGAGLGLELQLTRRFNVRIDYGWALTDVERVGGGNEVDAGDSQWHLVATLVY
jgi:hemolysin activation/secretion protein